MAWVIFVSKPFSAVKFGFQWQSLRPYAHLKEPVEVNAYQIGAFMPGFILGIFAYLLYELSKNEGIPEIVDFNVLPKYRRPGVGTQLMDKVESEIADVSSVAGIGVGLDPDYGATQRLYALRGYVPDGRGLYQRGHYPVYGEQITVDDDLVSYLTKKLR
jgi:GNAT superfamily N-acetyltransferase